MGHPVEFVDVPPEQAVPAMVNGLPAFVAEQIAAIFAELRAGAQSEVTTAVRRLTGHRPGGLARFLAHLAAARSTSDVAGLVG